MGVFNVLKNLFFNFYLPQPAQWAGYGSVVVTVLMISMITIALARQKEPWQRWVSVLVFCAVSLFYFFIQLTMILISIIRLTCCSGRAMVWVPTSRGKGSDSAPPPALVDKKA